MTFEIHFGLFICLGVQSFTTVSLKYNEIKIQSIKRHLINSKIRLISLLRWVLVAQLCWRRLCAGSGGWCWAQLLGCVCQLEHPLWFAPHVVYKMQQQNIFCPCQQMQLFKQIINFFFGCGFNNWDMALMCTTTPQMCKNKKEANPKPLSMWR